MDKTMEDKVLKTLRAQAWERAKAELNSVLVSYWDGPGKDEKFQHMDELVRHIVCTVEDNGLVE